MKDVNRFPHAYTSERFPNFCAEFFQIPKTARVFLRTVQLKRHNCGQCESLRASRHPMDVPFVHEFCWGMYDLDAITHTRTTVLQPFFRGHLCEPVPEENFWTLCYED